jgi:8-oxo-dGTP pyrophosphatase MutT (NUDIX family)
MNPHEVQTQSCLVAASTAPAPYRDRVGVVPVATPRPAASVIVLRRGGRHADRGLEMLLLKRSDEARFMPGVWVFPGGAVDPEDGDGEEGFRACALRELEEEAGIELGDPEALVRYSHWITPELVPVRFDTWFFLALAPAHSSPEPDGAETVDAAWWQPGRALEAHRRGELSLVFPTIKQLESLAGFQTSEEALEAARGKPVEAILPRVIGEGSEQRVVLPGEPGYED